jgi:tRNA modification GTPase
MSKATQGDTIYAPSTGVGKAAIAIVRVSGSGSASILRQLCPRIKISERRAVVTPILDANGKVLDRGVVLNFCGPRSFTGEDMIEFQVTGSRAIIQGLLRALADFPFARPAEPGEFARRAFENGKLDLVEVEGLASVIEAETRAQLDHAWRMAAGELSGRCEDVRELLLRATADLEAALDFSDIEDAANLSVVQILPLVRQAHDSLAVLLQHSGVSERLREGMTVVIAGPPNVGKSTLLNHLAKREVALVSSIPGTTRDSLEIVAEIAGYPITFVDTAGIRETTDPIEALGIARSRNWSSRANLVLWLSDNDDSPPEQEISETLVLPVRTKADRPGGSAPTNESISISALTGRGIDELLRRIGNFASNYFAGAGSVALGNERQRAAARDAQSALQEILLWPGRPEELVAEDLRQAAHAMGRLTGRIGVEEVLGQIFSRLCVGK